VVCRHAPDDVARIDILDAHFRAGLIKVVVDRGAQKSSDVLQFRQEFISVKSTSGTREKFAWLSTRTE
jgi:hypothetical protein